MPKSLIIFCDGTGMDGLLADGKTTKADGSVIGPGNAIRLSRAVKKEKIVNDQTVPQIVYYQSGAGTVSGLKGDNPLDAGDQLTLAGYGADVASKIRDIYAFIAQNYSEGDDICLFGFSRGAFTARKVAGLIDRIGLLSPEEMGKFFTLWMELVNGGDPPRPTTPVPIRCVGVWDTVEAIFTNAWDAIQNNPIQDMLGLRDNSLPANVQLALHGVSMQENRKQFQCTLWDTNTVGPNQTLKQIVFPGGHDNLGGGPENEELTDIALAWMAGEIRSFIELDDAYLDSLRPGHPKAPWGQHQPFNGYMSTPAALRAIMGTENRLDNGGVLPDSLFHPSVAVAPTVLDEDVKPHMITLVDVEKRFSKKHGSQWNPTYVELNSYEQDWKDNWGKTKGVPQPGHPGQRLGRLPIQQLARYRNIDNPHDFVKQLQARKQS